MIVGSQNGSSTNVDLCSLHQPNSDFESVLMHPRFGHIMGLVASRDIAEGEEITVDYNYGDDGPTWYNEAEKGER